MFVLGETRHGQLFGWSKFSIKLNVELSEQPVLTLWPFWGDLNQTTYALCVKKKLYCFITFMLKNAQFVFNIAGISTLSSGKKAALRY